MIKLYGQGQYKTIWSWDNVIIATQEVIEGVMGALMREDQEEASNSVSESVHCCWSGLLSRVLLVVILGTVVH